MVQLPESNFEKMTAEAREKECLDREKMLVSLPKSKVEQEYLTLVAARVVDLHEDIEDLMLVDNEETDKALKVKLVQGTRGILEKMACLHKMSLVAAKEGPDCAQRMFNPAPTYGELEEEEMKQLEKFLNEKEPSKKKEATKQGKSGWKGMKRLFPYSKPGYSGTGAMAEASTARRCSRCCSSSSSPRTGRPAGRAAPEAPRGRAALAEASRGKTEVTRPRSP
jgi:hypothetical protein